MLNVFVVAIVVVMAKSSALGDAEAKAGVYFFGAAILASMILSRLIKRMIEKASS